MRVNYLGTENYNQNVKSKIYVSFIGFMLQYVISGNDSCWIISEGDDCIRAFIVLLSNDSTSDYMHCDRQVKQGLAFRHDRVLHNI